MICRNCGKEISDDAKFCTFCGSKVEMIAYEPVAEPVVEPAAESVVEPAAESFAEPAVQPYVAPAADQTAEPYVAPTAAQTAAQTTEQTAGSAYDGSWADAPQTDAAYAAFAAIPADGEETQKKKKPLGAIIAIAAVLVAAVLLVVFVLPKLSSGSSAPAYMYLDEDYELYFLGDLKEKTEPIKVAEDCADAYKGVIFTRDGKGAYYLEQKDPDYIYSKPSTLYYIDLTKAGKADPVKVSKSVYAYSYFYVMEDNSLLYLKDEETLYRFNPKTGENDKLASDVYDYDYMKKEKSIYYTEYDSADGYNGYIYNLETGEKEKIFKNAYEMYFNVYYDESFLYAKQKDDELKLYVKNPGEDEEKILSDVDSLGEIIACKPGNLDFYYFTNDCFEFELKDLVRDDYAESDAENSEPPVYPEYPGSYSLYTLWDVYKEGDGWTYEDYQTSDHHPVVLSTEESQELGLTQAEFDGLTDEYEVYDIVSALLDYRGSVIDAAYEEAVAQYNLEYDLYSSIEDRIYMREYLDGMTETMDSYTLHHYVNGEDTVVAEGLTSTYYYGSFEDGIVIYEKTDIDLDPVCDIDELDSAYDLYSYIDDMSTGSYVLNIDGKESEFELEYDDAELSYVYTFGDGGVVVDCYNYDDYSEYYDIYKIEGGALKHVTDIEDCGSVRVIYDEKSDKEVLYYFADMDEDEGTLYRYDKDGATKIASDVIGVTIYDDGSMCLKEGDYYEMELTYVDAKGESKSLGDETEDYAYLGNGKLLFIDDSDLKYFDGKEVRKIKSDVLYFWVSDEEYGSSI